MTNIFNKSSRVLSVVGFSVLAAFSGIGVGWLATAILATIFKQRAEQLLTESTPMLIVGGALGLIVGLVVSVRVARMDPKSELRIEKRYVGYFGRLKIYAGAPLFIFAAFTSLLATTLSNRFGDRIAIYSCLAVLLVLTAASLFLYDRIPKRFIIPIGVVGWLLIVFLAFSFSFLL